jgi:hypothetical protein
MKNTCMAKPAVRCSSGSESATKARNGSMATLIEAVSSHSIRLAAQHRRRVGRQDQRDRRQDRAIQQIGPATAQSPPGPVAQMADDRLHQETRDRRGDPQDGQFVDVRAQGLEDPAGVDVLQTPHDLHAEQAAAHVPDLKEAEAAFGGDAVAPRFGGLAALLAKASFSPGLTAFSSYC